MPLLRRGGDSIRFGASGSNGLDLSTRPPLTSDTKRCPFCAEEIRAEAIACRFCGRLG